MSTEHPSILQIIPRLDTGGAEIAVLEIADALARAGARALVAAEPGRLVDRLTASGGELIAFPAASKNPLRILANARSLAALVAGRQVDLIHARSRAPAWSGLIAARRAHIPFVTTYHGAYGETNALKRAYNSIMARGDVVIANSRFTAELIRQRYGTRAARIASIHRGVDSGAFDPDGVARERLCTLRQRWGIDASAPIILNAARLTSWKGQEVLIEAMARLDRAHRDAHLVLAGDGQGRHAYAQKLRRQIATCGLGRRVHLVGHVADIAAAYLTAHVTVIASVKPEAFGRTAIEAAAMQCPVIATDLGAPPETILAPPLAVPEAMTGWLVPPGKAEALAERLAEALALARSAREQMGKRARRHVLERFTVEAMQRRTLAVYDSLLGSALEERFCAARAPCSPTTTLARQP